jgi:hypothetical protein
MGNEEWPRTFVFLLKFNTTKVDEIAKNIGADRLKWSHGECVFLPVTGDFDMVVTAHDGTTEDALVYAAYLTNTTRYTVCSTLTGFREKEFRFAAGLDDEDPHKKV